MGLWDSSYNKGYREGQKYERDRLEGNARKGMEKDVRKRLREELEAKMSIEVQDKIFAKGRRRGWRDISDKIGDLYRKDGSSAQFGETVMPGHGG